MTQITGLDREIAALRKLTSTSAIKKPNPFHKELKVNNSALSVDGPDVCIICRGSKNSDGLDCANCCNNKTM